MLVVEKKMMMKSLLVALRTTVNAAAPPRSSAAPRMMPSEFRPIFCSRVLFDTLSWYRIRELFETVTQYSVRDVTGDQVHFGVVGQHKANVSGARSGDFPDLLDAFLNGIWPGIQGATNAKIAADVEAGRVKQTQPEEYVTASGEKHVYHNQRRDHDNVTNVAEIKAYVLQSLANRLGVNLDQSLVSPGRMKFLHHHLTCDVNAAVAGFRQVSLDHVDPGAVLCIDDVLLRWDGDDHVIIYIRTKPADHGMYGDCVCVRAHRSQLPIVVDIIVHSKEGRKATPATNAYNMARRLARDVPAPRILVVDRGYGCVSLATQLARLSPNPHFVFGPIEQQLLPGKLAELASDGLTADSHRLLALELCPGVHALLLGWRTPTDKQLFVLSTAHQLTRPRFEPLPALPNVSYAAIKAQASVGRDNLVQILTRMGRDVPAGNDEVLAAAILGANLAKAIVDASSSSSSTSSSSSSSAALKDRVAAAESDALDALDGNERIVPVTRRQTDSTALPSRQQLEAMPLTSLKALATVRGVKVKGKTKKDYVNALKWSENRVNVESAHRHVLAITSRSARGSHSIAKAYGRKMNDVDKMDRLLSLVRDTRRVSGTVEHYVCLQLLSACVVNAYSISQENTALPERRRPGIADVIKAEIEKLR
jgi:hypothetical protein